MAVGDPFYPFQVPPDQLEECLDELVLSTVASLSSFYLALPRGPHFLEYEEFRRAYDELRLATADFTTLDRHSVRVAAEQNALVLVVLRCIVGVSPPDLADMASEISGLRIDQGFARAQDQTMPYLVEETRLKSFARGS
ncbi:MAG TPA: hypothetical protein VGR43_01320 [Dehalococcoidia bacterium]|jgi:hypothetical protein|nr:hypothetical protein [Dehalococcoidia bacterium]